MKFLGCRTYRLVYKSMSLHNMVYISLAMDYATLVLNLVGFFSLTSLLICLDNHVDAAYHTTAEVRHCIVVA